MVTHYKIYVTTILHDFTSTVDVTGCKESQMLVWSFWNPWAKVCQQNDLVWPLRSVWDLPNPTIAFSNTSIGTQDNMTVCTAFRLRALRCKSFMMICNSNFHF